MAVLNPVMRGIHAMRDAWQEATQDASVRLVIWRLPRNAARMMAAFFELQRHSGEWNAADYFMRLELPFEIGFHYSRELNKAVLDSYAGSRESYAEQGIAWDWPGAASTYAESAAGSMQLLESFATHHGGHFRRLAVVLEPERVVSQGAMEHWLTGALAAASSRQVVLVLVDTLEERQWQSLLERHVALARLVQPDIDLFDIAGQTAAQSPGGGSSAGFRLLLTDLFTLLEKADAGRVAQLAQVALAMAARNGWPDQQVVVHSMVGGAWLKQGDCQAAVQAYRQARDCALAAGKAGNPAATDLLMQSWFSEGGAWLADKQPLPAADAYRQGAEAAAQVPNPIFVIEGYRMAGYCLEQAGQREDAQKQYQRAIAAGRELPAEQRRNTTLGLALNDLMRLHDDLLVWNLSESARKYQAGIGYAHELAEARADRLGADPEPTQLDAIEQELHEELDTVFQKTRMRREELIEHSHAPARTVVAWGRELLHPAWNGLPEIVHPLAREVEAWSEPPPWQVQAGSAELPTPPPAAQRAPVEELSA